MKNIFLILIMLILSFVFSCYYWNAEENTVNIYYNDNFGKVLIFNETSHKEITYLRYFYGTNIQVYHSYYSYYLPSGKAPFVHRILITRQAKNAIEVSAEGKKSTMSITGNLIHWNEEIYIKVTEEQLKDALEKKHEIFNALIRAIVDNDFNAALKTIKEGAVINSSIQKIGVRSSKISGRYSPFLNYFFNISPLDLANICKHYGIMKLLLNSGARPILRYPCDNEEINKLIEDRKKGMAAEEKE